MRHFEWVSIKKASELLQVPPDRLTRQCRDGKIQARKSGRAWEVLLEVTPPGTCIFCRQPIEVARVIDSTNGAWHLGCAESVLGQISARFLRDPETVTKIDRRAALISGVPAE